MKTSYFLIALFLIVSLSCKQETSEPSNTGTMTGRVIPFDVNGDSLNSFRGGTEVWLKGTNFGTTTDSNGMWTLKDVPAGIYSVLATKPGFDTSGYDDQRFSGAGIDFIYDLNVTRMPTDTIVLDYVADTTLSGTPGNAIFYRGHISSKNLQSYVIRCTLAKASPNFSLEWSNYVYNGEFSGLWYTAIDSIGQQIDFVKGQEVYITSALFPSNLYHPNAMGYKIDSSNTMEVTIH